MAVNNLSSDDQWLSDISAGAGIVAGVEKGGTSGDVQAGFGAARLGANAGLFSPGANNAVGELGNVAGIVGGVQKGGVLGYGSAAVNTAQLGERLGAISSTSALGEAIPILGAGLAVVNFADNWQSGKTGSDALQGAEAGAAIGSIVPGVGTIIGAAVGGLVGAVSSLLGSGASDPEQSIFGNYLAAYNQGGAKALQGAPPQATFLSLAGLFDMRSSDLPFYQQFGRRGEGPFMVSMATQINNALAKGTITPQDSAQTIYQKVVNPWISSMANSASPTGAGWDTAGAKGDPGGVYTKGVVPALIQQLIGQYTSGQFNSHTAVTIGGSPITTLPQFGAAGLGAATKQAQATVGRNIQPLHEATLTMPGLPSSSSSASSMLPLLLAMPALLGGANAVPNPINPGTDVGVAGSDPAAAAGIGAGTTPGGGDSSNILSDIGTFLSGSGGTALEAGGLAALGLSQANAQKGTNDALASSLAAPGQPFTAAGQAELGQIQGGPSVGGPLGASITQQTTAAKNLGDVATADTTGNLTPAQSQQVKDFIAQQRAMVDTQLAASGTTDSSAREAAYQQIDNNAAELTQSLTQQNITTGTAALNAVQQTYTSLLSQALQSSEFGFSTELAAVQTQIQSDTALAASLNQLFAGIATGYGNAVGGANRGTATGGVANTVGKVAGAAAGAAPGTGGPLGDGVGGTGDNGGPGLPSSGIGAAGYNPDGTPITSGATAYGYDQNVSPDSSLTDFSSDPFSGDAYAGGLS